MDFAAWQELAANSPARALATWQARRDAIPAAQRAAIFANAPSDETLLSAWTEARGPLVGIPYAMKDLFDVAELPTRGGGRFLSEVRPAGATDGALARDLKAAGLVLAAKTHLHEYAYGLTGENPHFGHCTHPDFPMRTSGGSSSGSVALVAGDVLPFAIGTDTGGSIRVPAAFCGVYGLRLEPHQAWIADAFPLAPSFDTAGWFTRTAADMATSMRALIGTPEPLSRELRGAWLGFEALGQIPDDDVRVPVENLGQALAPAADASLRSAFLAATEHAVPAYAVLQSTEALAVHAAWIDQRKADYGPDVWGRIDRGRHWSTPQRDQAERTHAAVLAFCTAFFAEHDYLVLPATPLPALGVDACTAANRDRLLALTTPGSLAARPVLTCPVGLPSGLSSGVQIIVKNCHSPALAHILAHPALRDLRA